MAISATISITINLQGDIVGTVPVAAMSNSASPAQHVSIALVNGNNTLTPPTGASFALIVPPATSTVTKTIKGVSGDTGVPIATALPFLRTLANTTAFIITTNNTETIDVYWL